MNTLTWQNVRVRPTSVVPLASGNIVMSSMTFTGVGTTNVGTLTETGPTCNSQNGTIVVVNNTIYGGPMNGLSASGGIILGTGGNDVIVGTSAANYIAGGGGNDTICGLGGNDTLNGEGGDDTIFGGDGNDAITGGSGDDDLSGENNNDDIYGGSGIDNCTGGSGTDNIGGCGPADENAEVGQVTVVKDAVPNDVQNFGFVGSWTFTIDDDSDATLPNTWITAATDSATRTVTEAVTPGWTLTGLSCTGAGPDSSTDLGTRTATINIDSDEEVLCTFTNTSAAATATLTVNATVTNDNGGTATTGSFSYFIDATAVTSGTPLSGLTAGAHTVSVTGTTGYSVTIGGDCAANGSITLAGGDNKACSVTLNDIAPKLTVTKVLVTDHGGTQVITDFPLFVDATSVSSGVQNSFNAGTYTVSETTIPSQYTSIITGDCASNGTITLAIGDVKSCVITNDDKPAHVIVTKVVVNDNGGTLVASDFIIGATANDASPTSFTGSVVGTDVTMDAGSYTIAETAPYGYAVSYSADCTGSILPGETKNCTVTNDDIQPVLTVTKVVVNDHGGTLQVTDFPLFVNGGPVLTGVPEGFDAGMYLVSELGLPTYFPSISGDCAPDGTITLTVGDVKSCTITNDDIAPTLTIIKNVINNDGATATASQFTLRVNTRIVTNGDPTEFVVGDYTVNELEDINYDFTLSGDCNTSNGNIRLELAENKTCTITNNDRPGNATASQNRAASGNSGENSSRRGQETNRFGFQAGYLAGLFGGTPGAGFGGGIVPPGAFGGGNLTGFFGGTGPFSPTEKDYICSMQESLRDFQTDSFVDWLAGRMAAILGRDASQVASALKDTALCAPAPQAKAPEPEPVAIRVNAKGYIVSSNPVWNACVRGKATLGLIKANPDRVMHRQGSVEVMIPKTCDDYHRSTDNVWAHPDHPELFVALDSKGRLASELPHGFVALKDGTSAANVAKK